MMNPDKYHALVILGVMTGDWWTSVGPVKKALSALAVMLVIGFSAGALVTTTLLEQRGMPARLSEVEKRAVRTEARVDSLAAQQAEDVALRARVTRIEEILWRVDDRTKRIACLLAGNSGPACI